MRPVSLVSSSLPLSDLSDERRFNFNEVRKPTVTRLNPDMLGSYVRRSSFLGFNSSDLNRGVVCSRRSVRKRVLHATRKSGIVGQRRPIWNKNSKIRCK